MVSYANIMGLNANKNSLQYTHSDPVAKARARVDIEQVLKPGLEVSPKLVRFGLRSEVRAETRPGARSRSVLRSHVRCEVKSI